MPVLLTRPTSLPQTTQRAADDIGVTRVYVAGGTGAVSETVVNQLGIVSERAFGATRYETASAVAEMAVQKAWVTPSVAGVTTGQNYPDALSGGGAMGARDGIMLLTPSGTLCTSAEAILLSCQAELSAIQVFGGHGAVEPVVYDSVCSLWE
jgi:putative cell wall-binding protein